MLKYALLGLLHYREMSGYDLEQFINSSIGHFWHAKLSQIYRTLKALEEEGLVTSRFEEQEDTRSKRIYTLTDTGLKEFQDWLTTFDTELDSTKVPFLVRLFFFGMVDKSQIEAQLRVWTDLHQRQLAYYQNIHIPEDVSSPDDLFFWKATLRFGVMYEEMVLRWLDEMMKDLSLE